MVKELIGQMRAALVLLLLMSILTGLLYPLGITAFAQLFFPWKANGSLIELNGTKIGSMWIGQSFTTLPYFWGRPSATSTFTYNGEASSGSNSGPSNLAFIASVAARVHHIKQWSVQDEGVPVPVDLVTASASGLDPEISPFAAYYQVPRVAKARHIDEETLRELIGRLIQRRTLGVLGEPRVNVLQLNLALDDLRNNHEKKSSKS